jgi:uncharacterized protein YkwD
MTRPRAARRILAVLLTAGLAAALLAGCTPEQDRTSSVIFVNHERTTRGLRSMAWSDDLGNKAQRWAAVLAERGTLSHSVLSDGVAPGWRAIGENVGYGESVSAVHTQFMNSKPHRDAILNRTYRAIGTGVAQRGNRVYVVQVFKA